MKILHTSDWHLGRMLYGKRRDAEFSAFLSWLKKTIYEQNIDILLIAGDIFDTTTPTHSAQSLYYQFLCDVASTSCQHIVIIAGNHDSGSFLNAPKSLLRHLNVHVVGAKSDNITDEVLQLNDLNSSVPLAIICAVPYLRDKDLRGFESGESIDEKNLKLVEGLRSHYRQVCDEAMKLQAELFTTHQRKIPIIGMGHLFAAGGTTTEGDGVRDLYVGTLAHISANAFPKELDYVALGHLHSHQLVGQQNHIRYSGSPIAMGFAEASQVKKVLIITFEKDPVDGENEYLNIDELPIPQFQKLIRVQGCINTIMDKLDELINEKSDAWVEIEYTGKTLIPSLREDIEQKIEGSLIEIRRIKNRLIFDTVLKRESISETLEDITPLEIFNRCLKSHELNGTEDENRLTELFKIALHTVENEVYPEDDGII